MNKRLAPYGDDNFTGNVAMIGGDTKSPRLEPHGIVAAIGTAQKSRLLPQGIVAAVGNDDKSPRVEAPLARRLVRLKAKAD